MNKVLKNKYGTILIIVIWGLGLSALFRKICKGRNCIVVKAVNPRQVKNKIFKHDNQCYQYTPEIIKCDDDDKKKKIST